MGGVFIVLEFYGFGECNVSLMNKVQCLSLGF